MNNQQWSQKILQKVDPLFRPRWEIYNETVKNQLNNKIIWIDCGSGDNGMVESCGYLAKIAIGVDVGETKNKNNFVKADIRKLPFASEYADLITLRFVAEHFNNVPDHLAELVCVLKKDGKIIILTTNVLSPLIFLPRLFLPNSIKSKILTKLFRVKDEDVFPTFHKLNSPKKFHKLSTDFEIEEMIFISDLNNTRKWVFFILLLWHKITALKPLNKFRTNILVTLKKKGGSY